MNTNETVLRPVRVLLCGMKMPENQISRALSRYPNVTVTWKPGDPGVNWPTDHDAAVIPIAQCSHAAYYAVKELYKGKPTFVLREGFSEIKERFKKWLDGIPALAPPKTALSKAFEDAKVLEINTESETKTDIKNDIKETEEKSRTST